MTLLYISLNLKKSMNKLLGLMSELPDIRLIKKSVVLVFTSNELLENNFFSRFYLFTGAWMTQLVKPLLDSGHDPEIPRSPDPG